MKNGCLVLLLVAIGATACGAEEPALKPAPNAEQPKLSIDELVAKLHSDDYWAREEATTALQEVGADAIPAIGRAVIGGDLEVAWRAIEVLEQHSASDDAAIAAAAQKELLALSKSPDGAIAASADRALAGWRLGKRNMAIAKLRELGAQVSDQHGGLVMFGGFGAPAMIHFAPGDIDVAIEGVALADVLKGGDEGDAVVVLEDGEKIGVDFDLEVDDEVAKTEAIDDTSPEAAEVAEAEVAEAEVAEVELAEAEEEVAEETTEVEEIGDARVRLDIAVARAVEFRAAPMLPAGGGFVVEAGPPGFASGADSATMHLDGAWQGGDDGLKHAAVANNIVSLNIDGADVGDGAIEHLAKIKPLTSLYVRNARFSKEGLRKLHKLRPEMTIMAMGEALVGISGEPHPKGFTVVNVVPDSGAANAGIDLGDVVVSCEGQPIGSISDLTVEIFQRKIGERVEVKVLRGEEEKTLAVTLGARD
jgi:hypothetical protein